MPVILSAAKNLTRRMEILRCAQNDRRGVDIRHEGPGIVSRNIMALITSTSNPRISRARELQTTKGRKKHGLFLMEGPHLLEVLFENNVLPTEVYYQPALLERTVEGRALLRRLL